MNKQLNNLIFASVLTFSLAIPARAAVTDANLNRAETNLNRSRESSAEERLRQTAMQMSQDYKSKKQQTSANKTPANEQTVILKKIEFSQSTILTKDFLNNISKKYVGRPLTSKDIENITNDINNEYIMKGYIAARAFLPKQDGKDGVLFVTLVEGKIHQVNVQGNKHTKLSYIQKRINWPKYSDVQMGSLEGKILDFNSQNDAKARVNLAAGPVYGTTDVNVILNEPNLITGSVFSDNAGQDETGLYRVGTSLQLNSITGYRDIFSLGASTTRGAHSVSGSYEIPVLSSRVGVGADYSNTEIVSGQLESLSVKGNFYDYYAYLKKPFLVTPRMSNDFTLSYYIKKGSNYISGMSTQTTDTDLASASLDNILIFGGGYIFNMVSFSKGLKVMENDKDFWRANYNGEYNQRIIAGLSFNLKGRAQMGGGADELPSSEKFQIGGVNTVRGYNEGLLLAQQGADAAAELQYDFTKYMPKYVNNTSLYTFFDFGYISDTKSFILQPDLQKDIYSTGLGLRLGLFNHLDGNITVARTLKTNVFLQDNETKVLFFVQGKF